MDIEKQFDIMFETFRNETKLNIIFLLIENEKLNVTQMSKFMNVSRSNLYQTVSQLVRDGVLLKPVVKTRKNYVEKYYSLNPEFLSALDWDRVSREISSMNAEQARSVIKSYLASQTFNMALLSERILHAGDDEILKLRDAWVRQEAIILYSIHHSENYPGVQKNLKNIMDELETNSKKQLAEKGPVMRLMILALPYI